MRQGFVWLIGATLAGAAACGDGGSGPSGGDEGTRLATQFQRLADSVEGAGYSPTAEALRHAAEIVRLTGHATSVTLTIDGTSRSFLAVAEQLDFPQLQCTWPSDSGTVPPGDTLYVDPGDGGGGGWGSGGASPPGGGDLDAPVPEPGTPGDCAEVGVYSMRTLIAWEPEHMAEVVRLVADPGSGEVNREVPDVMTGLPTETSPDGAMPPEPDPAPGDTAIGGGGGGSGGWPGFMGEYLVGEHGTWYAVEGSQTNALESSGGACTADRATIDWAEFRCEAARFGYELSMRVEPILVDPATGVPEDGGPEGSHAIARARSSVDGVRLTVVAWVPPTVPEPGPPPPVPGPPLPVPPDSSATGLTRLAR
jgi:hypothetical protein